MVCESVRRDNPPSFSESVRRDNPPSFSSGIIDRTDAQTMLYLTCTMIASVDLAHLEETRAKDWVSVDCGTNSFLSFYL